MWGDGRRRDVGLGGWPLTTLTEAREKVFENRRLAGRSDDPLADKRKVGGPTFQQAAAQRLGATARGARFGIRRRSRMFPPNQFLLIHETQQGCRDVTYEPSRFPVAVPYPSPHRATPAYVVVTSSDLDTSRNKASMSGLSWISRNQFVFNSNDVEPLRRLTPRRRRGGGVNACERRRVRGRATGLRRRPGETVRRSRGGDASPARRRSSRNGPGSR